MHSWDIVSLQLRQIKWQATLRNSQHFMGQTQTFLSPTCAGLHQDHPQVHRKAWRSIPKHCRKNKSSINHPHDWKWKHRLLWDHVRCAPAYRVCHLAYERQTVLWKRFQIFLLQSWLTYLHQKSQGQDPWLARQRIQFRGSPQWAQRLCHWCWYRNGPKVS